LKVGMMFYDLSKAFDTVNIEILLEKLAALGILGDDLHWFKSYVTDRTQYTDVNGYRSNRVTTKNGVPQRSVLGPILFLLYINSIKSIALKGVPYLYADDIAILYSADKYEQLKIKMEDDLQLLTN
jgi:ribonucleases P/MRP protein subunit RPP40